MGRNEICSLIAILVLAAFELIPAIVTCVKNNSFAKVKDIVIQSIKEAEVKFGDGHGEEKKQYVLEKVSAYCDEIGISFKKVSSLVKDLIENVIKYYNSMIK